jgi:hypothetical protein
MGDARAMLEIRTLLLALVLVCLTAAGCSSTRTIRVQVPPRVDLHAYPSVGLVTFNSSGNADLQRLSTQRFLQEIQSAQPGTRVIELGAEADLLASIHRNSWDDETLKLLKQSRGLDVIVLGQLDVQRAKPKVEFSASAVWKAVNVRADVNASLSARLVETASGATMWTDSSRLTTTLANANVNDHGGGTIGIRDTQAVYGDMIDHLVCDITDAFRPHYVLRRVPKDQVQTANAGE